MIDLSKIVQINPVNTELQRKSPVKFQTGNDSFTPSEQLKVVKVYNDSISDIKDIHLVSPGFNGCFGINILTDNETYFSHFPPFAKGRMQDSLEKALSCMKDSDSAKIIFIAPVPSNGKMPKEFSQFEEKISKKFKDYEVEYLKYPERSKGKTYCYDLREKDGKIAYSLKEVTTK